MNRLLIRNAEMLEANGATRKCDVRAGRFIEAIGDLTPTANEQVMDAAGGLLVPGLCDHHIHLAAYAASLESVPCGPPGVKSPEELAASLHAAPSDGWIRGVGYHESVLEHLDSRWLDANGPARPVRIQHRSGRLWVLNTLAMEALHDSSVPASKLAALKQQGGRLFDDDQLMRTIARSEPPMAKASAQLAAYGVTGITDMTPANDARTLDWFAELQSRGDILQTVRLAGAPALSEARPQAPANGQGSERLRIGETKIHLHDSALPTLDELTATIATSHRHNRNIAVHCVTEVALVFTLAALRAAGVMPGDRIEHASVVPKALIEQLLELEVGVVTQPGFVAERGDAYLRDMDNHSELYRVKSLMDAGVPVAFGSDCPFGGPNPWAAMQAATMRRTREERTLGEAERITPEAALAGYLGSLDNPFTQRTIAVGAAADLCLLNAPWQRLRSNLDQAQPMLTLRNGEIIYARDSSD